MSRTRILAAVSIPLAAAVLAVACTGPPELSVGDPGTTPPPSTSALPPPGPTPPPPAATDCAVFPPDNPWNTDISDLPVHPQSEAWVESIGDDGLHPAFGTQWEGEPNGIPYNIVDGSAAGSEVEFDYADESDPGPYPIPDDPAIEAGDDGHILIVDETDCTLYELYDARTDESGSWQAGAGAIFDLSSNELRPETWTSADAAGLPIYPGLVTYDEVSGDGVIDHALRFTAEETRRAFIPPATHWASDTDDPDVAPMGARFRLRAGYDCSPFAADVQVICDALKRYGMFLADNGSDWFVSGAPDPRWSDDDLSDLAEIPGSAFEVVDTGEPIVTP